MSRVSWSRKQDGQLLLRESAQCPDADEEAFQDVTRHKYFNTNNLWIRLDKLQEVIDKHDGVVSSLPTPSASLLSLLLSPRPLSPPLPLLPCLPYTAMRRTGERRETEAY